MAFDDVDHCEAVFDVAEEDHVVLKDGASKIGSEFRALAAHFEGQRSEMVAIGADAEKEVAGDIGTSAGFSKISS
jgi:hypothetical protein